MRNGKKKSWLRSPVTVYDNLTVLKENITNKDET